jgi:NAD(P)-dependent dehydrogenase (short-subunit alcohol dehydrogenase family)
MRIVRNLFEREANEAEQQGLHIQQEVDRREKRKKREDDKPMQAGARIYPSHFAKQHQAKPGIEANLNPKPMYDAPAYKGSEKLKDKVAIITGGDSGIGRSVAVLYAREGADVVIVYLNEHRDADDTRQAVEKEGRKCMIIAGDVADARFCDRVVTQTIERFGKVDILVNNAAFQEHVKDFVDLTEEHFDRTIKTNLYGYFHMAKSVVPHLKPGSAIIMTGSVTGIEGNRYLLDYSMTKGGIHAFARSLSANLAKKDIRVNVVAPGPVWTPLNPADKQADEVQNFGSTTVMKRAAQPEEIAPAYVFLAAPCCSSYITGEILPIIGGYAGG